MEKRLEETEIIDKIVLKLRPEDNKVIKKDSEFDLIVTDMPGLDDSYF